VIEKSSARLVVACRDSRGYCSAACSSSPWSISFSTGVGVWGLNQPVAWGWDITNFVFWIGIGHARNADFPRFSS